MALTDVQSRDCQYRFTCLTNCGCVVVCNSNVDP